MKEVYNSLRHLGRSWVLAGPRVAAALAGVLALCGWTSGQATLWQDVQLAGCGDRLWLVLTTGPDADGAWGVGLYVRGPGEPLAPPQPPTELTGRVVRLAAAKHSLHLIFESGAHSEHTGRQLVPGPRLAGGKAVLALTGCEDSDGVLAVLSADALEALTTRPTTTQVAAEEGTDKWRLARYENGRWKPIAALGDWWHEPPAVEMCASAGVVHLFWQGSAQSDGIWQVSFAEGAWSEPAEVRFGEKVRLVAVTQVNRQVVLVVSRPPAQTPAGRVLVPVRRVQDAWLPGQPLAIGDQAVSFDLDTTAVAGMGARLFVAWLEASNRVRLGSWPISGGALPAEAVTLDLALERPWGALESTFWRYFLPLLMLALLVVVFWRRRESLMQPISPGKGRVLAESWRRVGAGLIDLLPFLILGGWLLWHYAGDELRAWMAADRQAQAGGGERLWAPNELAFAWACVRAGYCLYGLLMELGTGSTIGKRWLGCQVSSETGQRPTPRALIIRNVLRWVELQGEFLVVPVFLMIITRSNQRLGDILARTIVHRPADEEEQSESTQDRSRES